MHYLIMCDHHAQITDEELPMSLSNCSSSQCGRELGLQTHLSDPIILYTTRLYCFSNYPTLPKREDRFENREPTPQPWCISAGRQEVENDIEVVTGGQGREMGCMCSINTKDPVLMLAGEHQFPVLRAKFLFISSTDG